ncbi:hypothetical protein [Pseudohoeflea coraliihabitans]|uniref:Uncharacterized protein n=1 Tax=Pseudohoeflea coraliihabitans TaxID=2860393 RepID=A0ABS6WR11_9HYPH|nr:hypothetical protein [Pseudohoeflea sp. DP4N28-3]MBW3098210.1 hypothetical protein [Pseudohoeflea sp. DP4N28-3]
MAPQLQTGLAEPFQKQPVHAPCDQFRNSLRFGATQYDALCCDPKPLPASKTALKPPVSPQKPPKARKPLPEYECKADIFILVLIVFSAFFLRFRCVFYFKATSQIDLI